MYETGLGVAFLVWLCNLILLLTKINSQAERNLRKIGMRHSWLTQTPKQRTASDAKRGILGTVGKFALIQSVALVSVILSWGYVLWAIGAILYAHAKDYGAPQEVKEFRWRMRNLDLPLDEIIRGMLKISGAEVSIDDERERIQAYLFENDIPAH
ncbi:hypothetical protein [Massilia endophytica]|uniref:hypothetical protein n=1 Tax=Massilia endophytica TaxID=2899220 RepID=UPI001E3D5126|nr:hypothetical protein [Massilia endophytica]UGQ44952.1 hypothetical protein LSQ66_14210 [Massilia endophytica]